MKNLYRCTAICLFFIYTHTSEELLTDYQVLLELCRIINYNPVTEEEFYFFEYHITIHPKFLSKKLCGYSLAQRIKNREDNGVIDKRILNIIYEQEITITSSLHQSYQGHN